MGVSTKQVLNSIAASQVYFISQTKAAFEKSIRGGGSSRSFAKEWNFFKNTIINIKFLSCGTSTSVSTLEIRIKTHRRLVLHIPMYLFGESGLDAAKILDLLWDKAAPNDLREIKNVVRHPGEYYNTGAFGSVVAGEYIMDDDNVARVVCGLVDRVREFHASGKAQNKRQEKDRMRALAGMQPFVRRFLENGGTYEEMVELLQTETVASVQDT